VAAVARLTTFERSGLHFDVRDVGPENGAAVVCLHGFPQDGTAYDEVSRLLDAAGCRVLTPDQRGYSPGARPAGRSAYVLEELADDAVALLDAAGLPTAHVVGHDWGGAVAWFLASRRSERVRSLTVLSTPHPAVYRALGPVSSQRLRASYMVFFRLPGLPELLAGLAGPGRLAAGLRRSGLDADHAAHYAERMADRATLSAALGWYRAIPVTRRGPGRVAVPTTYVVGGRDPFFSRSAVTRTRELVTAPYRLVELDAGHWLPETRAATVTDEVLRQLEGPPTVR
jgi:pimeloyl-ACP methyl ester carboxylesterase